MEFGENLSKPLKIALVIIYAITAILIFIMFAYIMGWWEYREWTTTIGG